MGWLATAIFAIAIIYFAVNHPRFRKGLWKGLLITLAIIVGLFVVAGGFRYWEKKRETYAKTLIEQADIYFYELKIASGFAAMHTVRGNVRNRSNYPLKSFRLKVTVQDCPAGKCETIGENDFWEFDIDVPPGQVRSFDEYVMLPDMPNPTARQWHYSIIELEAGLE